MPFVIAMAMIVFPCLGRTRDHDGRAHSTGRGGHVMRLDIAAHDSTCGTTHARANHGARFATHGLANRGARAATHRAADHGARASFTTGCGNRGARASAYRAANNRPLGPPNGLAHGRACRAAEPAAHGALNILRESGRE